jgi:hypothetical protein
MAPTIQFNEVRQVGSDVSGKRNVSVHETSIPTYHIHGVIIQKAKTLL